MRSLMIAMACVLAVGCGDDGSSGPSHGAGGTGGKGGAAGEAGAAGDAGAAGRVDGTSGSAGEAGSPEPGGGAAGEAGAPTVVVPSLSIHPSTNGKLQITGPTDFTAELVNGTGDITWTIEGGGALSATQGTEVRFTPPLGTATETLTATALGVSATVEVQSSPPVITGAVIPSLAAQVTVQYDAQDIPHIQCASAADCFAVQGYVQAHDRLFAMDFLRHTARSKLAELIGAPGLSQDVQLRTLMVTRSGHRLEDDLVSNMDAPTKALLTAFVGGINAYLAVLRTRPGDLPGEYAQLPVPITAADIADWSLQDSAALIRLQQFQLSENVTEESALAQFAAVYGPGGVHQDLAKLNALVRAAAPTTERAHTLSTLSTLALGRLAVTSLPSAELSNWQSVLAPLRARLQTLRESLRPAGEAVGSNNWVVASTKSATHVAMVANDPHIGLRYPPLFHLSALTSSKASDNLNLTGGTFPGLPGALIGRGAHVGWGVTVVGYDVSDLYLEQFLPQANCPSVLPCVLFKGAPASVLVVPQAFMVRVGPGASGLVNAQTLPNPPPQAVVVVPQHGPVIQPPDAGGRAISARWTGQEGNTQDLKAVLGLNTALNVDAAVNALTDFATGAQNFALADDQGHIAFDPHALVPVRKFADPALQGANVIPPWFPVPGDGTAEWGDGVADCASATSTPVPATCWIANAALPHGKDPAQGYFFTANADPIGVSDDNNPLAHQPYLSFDWSDSTGFRAKRIDDRLKQVIAEHGSVSLADMESIQTDHVSRPGMAFTEYVASLPTNGSDPTSLVAAKNVLMNWAANGWDCPSGLLGSDPTTSPVDPTPTVAQNSSGCFFFHAFLRTLISNVFTDDFAVAGQGVEGLHALKAMLFLLVESNSAASAAAATLCNDVGASGTLVTARTCAEQVNRALIAAYDALTAARGAPSQWVWGRVHTVSPVSFSPFATASYSPGPFARPGGAFTVDVGTPSVSGSGFNFAYSSGSNVRHISLMDPANPLVRMQLPGPERDVPLPSSGPDLLGQWVRNSYFNQPFGSQIDAVAVSTQTFTVP